MLSEKLTSIETETRRQLLMLLFQNSLSSYLQNLLVCGAVAFVIMQHSSAGHVLSPLGWLVGVAVLPAHGAVACSGCLVAATGDAVRDRLLLEVLRAGQVPP